MLFRTKAFIAVILSAATLTASVPSISSAETADVKIPAALQTPRMIEAREAFHNKDVKRGAALVRAEAQSGNQMAKVGLAVLYLSGRGVPKNRNHAIELLAEVVHTMEMPAAGAASDVLVDLSDELKRSPNPEDQKLSFLIALLPIIANPMAVQMGKMFEQWYFMP